MPVIPRKSAALIPDPRKLTNKDFDKLEQISKHSFPDSVREQLQRTIDHYHYQWQAANNAPIKRDVDDMLNSLKSAAEKLLKTLNEVDLAASPKNQIVRNAFEAIFEEIIIDEHSIVEGTYCALVDRFWRLIGNKLDGVSEVGQSDLCAAVKNYREEVGENIYTKDVNRRADTLVNQARRLTHHLEALVHENDTHNVVVREAIDFEHHESEFDQTSKLLPAILNEFISAIENAKKSFKAKYGDTLGKRNHPQDMFVFDLCQCYENAGGTPSAAWSQHKNKRSSPFLRFCLAIQDLLPSEMRMDEQQLAERARKIICRRKEN